MPAMRIAMKKGNQVKVAKNEEALAHLEREGFVPMEEQPPQPEDFAPVIMERPGTVMKRVPAKDVEMFLEQGYSIVGGSVQDSADRHFAKKMAKMEKRDQDRRKAVRPERDRVKPKTLEKKKGKGRNKDKAPDPNVVMADLLGPLPERDDATKAIVLLLKNGYDPGRFRQVLTNWNVKNVTEVPGNDRAELLLDLQNKAAG